MINGAMLFGIVYNDATAKFVVSYVENSLRDKSKEIAKNDNKIRAVIPFECCDLCGRLTPVQLEAYFVNKYDFNSGVYTHELLYCMDSLQEYGDVDFQRQYDWYSFNDEDNTCYNICEECFDSNTDEDLKTKMNVATIEW